MLQSPNRLVRGRARIAGLCCADLSPSLGKLLTCNLPGSTGAGIFYSVASRKIRRENGQFERRGRGVREREMLLKIAVALALGSIGLLALERLTEADDRLRLEETVEAQLQALRDHLFRR
jgi:hypothetical protein